MNHDMNTAVDSLTERLDQLMKSEPCKNKLIRLDEDIAAINLLDWLANASAPKAGKAYWSDRDGNVAMAGVASAWEFNLNTGADLSIAFQQAKKVLSGAPRARCFSYLSFSDDPSGVWPAFGYGRFWLPLIEVTETRKGSVLACHVWVGEEQDWQAEIQTLKALLQHLAMPRIENQFRFRLGAMITRPDHQGWSDLMGRALTTLEAGNLEKVVMSREVQYALSGNMSPWRLLKSWQQANAHSYSFIIEGKDEQYFLGCSPERLLKRHHNIIHTEALAGTSRRGKSRGEDRKMAADLMRDHKNIHENKLVLRDILDRLEPLCKLLDADRSHSILKLRNIQHLRYLVRGVLKPDVKDEELVALLHPTPAVGGAPREKAIAFINSQESYVRGLYAGACGVIGSDMTELAVSIRSACLTPDSLSLYSGAGIVQESSAESEWLELDNKLVTIQGVLSNLQQMHQLSCDDEIGNIDELSHTLS